MNELIKIESHFGRLTVSSREIAENFEKEHRSVLKSIDDLIAEMGSAQNYANLFMPGEYQHGQNKQTYREYYLTRDGFSLLVMGFTGSKALEWKLKYIDAFNKMERSIKEQIDYSALSPELQAVRMMIDDMARQKIEVKQLSDTVTTIKDTIITQPDNWREDLNRMFNKIVQSVGGKKFQELRHESYQLLESRAHVDLERRLMNMRARMLTNGASKSAIEKANKLDVIEADPKLREIYTSIIREYTIKFVA